MVCLWKPLVVSERLGSGTSLQTVAAVTAGVLVARGPWLTVSSSLTLLILFHDRLYSDLITLNAAPPLNRRR